MENPVSDLLPRLSLAERDRRYALVRAAMAAAGIDLIVAPASTARWEQTMADSRYLTSIGGFGTETLTIFPRQGESTAYVFNRAAFWRQAQDWVADVRDGHNHWADNIRERLLELGLVRGRIGIAGLAGLTRSPDGVVPDRTLRQLSALLPALEIVDATELMSRARAIKSGEEIALIQRATEIAEAMAASLRELRPGASERTAYAGLLNTLVSLGGEVPAMIIVSSGPNAASGNFVPTLRQLQTGDLIVGEIEGRYAGYSGQIVRPATLGPPQPAYRDLFAVARACFEAVLETLTAGVTLREVMAVYERAIAREGGGALTPAYPLMHARGLGDEYPAVLAPRDLERLGDVRLEAGMVFVLKPRAERKGVGSAQIGDSVVVGDRGGSRLGRQPLELIEVAWPTG